MEENNLLDPLNELHLFVLHLVFLPVINEALNELVADWNNHPLSSEHNFSPVQLWQLGMSTYQRTNPNEFNELTNIDCDYGIDYDGPALLEEDDSVVVPEFDNEFTQILNLQDVVDRNLEMNKIELYLLVLNISSGVL